MTHMTASIQLQQCQRTANLNLLLSVYIIRKGGKKSQISHISQILPLVHNKLLIFLFASLIEFKGNILRIDTVDQLFHPLTDEGLVEIKIFRMLIGQFIKIIEGDFVEVQPVSSASSCIPHPVTSANESL